MRDYLKEITLAFLAVSPVVIIQISSANPDKPLPPKTKGIEQYPDINYRSNYGEVKTDRHTGEMIIFDDPSWYADDLFVTPTKVYILWHRRNETTIAPVVYDLQPDNTLVGHWGYDHQVKVDKTTWKITGSISGDRIYPIKK